MSEDFNYKENTLNNIDAEEIILGSIIVNQNLINKIIYKINKEIFLKKEHQILYSIISKLYNSNKYISFISVINAISKQEGLKNYNHIEMIYKLVNKAINSYNFDEYVYLIIDKHFRRRLIEISKNMILLAQDTSLSLDIILYKIKLLISYIYTYKIDQQTESFPDLLENLLVDLHKASNNYSINGIESGFKDFDAITQGFQKSDLIILASRPSMGKTALSLNIVCNVAKNINNTVMIFSLEMAKMQLVYRILASNINLGMIKLKTGRINRDEWLLVKSGIETLSKYNIYINDEVNLSPSTIRSKIISLLQKDNNLNLIIIDYLQLIQSDQKHNNRNEELASITRSLKIIAKEFNLPIIVLSQLSRNVELRNNKKPILADLRESGCISVRSLIKRIKYHTNIVKLETRYKKAIIYCKDNINNRLTLEFIQKVYIQNKKILYHCTTKSGYHIKLTANHKIYTNKGWKRVDKIKSKEKIAICKRKLNLYLKNNELYKYNFYIDFEEVETIYWINKEIVYDILVTKNQNFIANDIILHNSIEQDADLVCMLYRDEYYNPDTLDKNIAEILIVKQRNGPIGNFRLGFNAVSNKFFNLN
uniref:Replicative DNA helicase n=1 Tax=Compsopogon caeruleus TaxID=31354 RepID=A0A1Z1XB61_9RHOD|nr:replication helicase subunit [Compsopogon caeruleus]ARX96027.1 replication helicase subunit [Compsopogon caeruleus]